MKMHAFLILKLLVEVQGVQYESGYSSTWGNSIPAQTYQTITFSQQFSRVPQISINPLIISDTLQGQAHCGYELYISSTTTSNFEVTLIIPSFTNKITSLTFYWVAIDDTRFTILQNFNEDNPQSKTLSHTNSRAETGIIILTSFLGSTKLDFTLNLGIITSTTVEVNVYQQNIINIGYIVILGPSECFDIETKIVQLPLDQNDSGVYKSRQVTKETDKIWLFFFQYFTFDTGKAFRLQLQPTFTDTTSEYQYSSWSDSISSFTKSAHQCATLKFPTIGPNPMLFLKVRISGLILRAQTNIFEFSIKDVDFAYIPVNMNQKIVIPKNVKSLTFLIKVKCNQDYKIRSSFYQCSTCSNNYKTIIRNCYHQQLTLQYFITYNILDIDYEQNLIINMITTQLKILQTVNNHEITDLLIGQIDLNLE